MALKKITTPLYKNATTPMSEVSFSMYRRSGSLFRLGAIACVLFLVVLNPANSTENGEGAKSNESKRPAELVDAASEEVVDANDADQMIDLSDLIVILVEADLANPAVGTVPSEPSTKELSCSIELASGTTTTTNANRTIPHGTPPPSKSKTVGGNTPESKPVELKSPVNKPIGVKANAPTQAPSTRVPQSPVPEVPEPPAPFVTKKSTGVSKSAAPKDKENATQKIEAPSVASNGKGSDAVEVKPSPSIPGKEIQGRPLLPTEKNETFNPKSSSRKQADKERQQGNEPTTAPDDPEASETTVQSDVGSSDSGDTDPPSIEPKPNSDGHNEEPDEDAIQVPALEEGLQLELPPSKDSNPANGSQDVPKDSAEIPEEEAGKESSEEPSEKSTEEGAMDSESPPQLLEIEGPVSDLSSADKGDVAGNEGEANQEPPSKKAQDSSSKSSDSGTSGQKSSRNQSKKVEKEKDDGPSDPAKNDAALESKPRPKMVKVKPLTEEEQDSPSLERSKNSETASQSKPKIVDAKKAREEDVNASKANRPEASSKTYVNRLPVNKTIPVLTQADANRAARVENCLAYYIANPESAALRSPWAVMHAMLPFGVEGEIMVGTKRVSSIQWMCYNGTCRTQKLFTPIGTRSFRPNVGGGVQGHEGQFLAMLAQSQVAAEYPIVVGQNQFSVKDLVRYEMATCKEKTELTFKLMGLSYYVDTNQSWQTADRKVWNIEKLVKEELAQPIVGAACGGTHRLMALTFAVRQRQSEGRPINGQFARAQKFVNEFIDYTWTLQNPDGSFSTNWFESRGNEPNMERKVQTTGHILEWLVFTLPDEKLKDPRIAKSIDFIISQIGDHRDHKWPIGPRGHATRALALYQQRMYGAEPGSRRTEMARAIDSQRLTK